MILLVMIIAVEVGSRLNHDRPFFHDKNIGRIAQNFSYTAIAAVGGCIVIIASGIDLSVGSVMGFSAVMMAFAYTTRQADPVMAVLIALAGGTLLGFFNGVLIGSLRLAPFIVTLGMLSIARGLSFYVSGGLNIPIAKIEAHPLLNLLANHSFFVMLGCAIVASLYMKWFRWGRYVYALGANEEAARFSGLNIPLLKIMIYSLAGFVAAIAGVCFALRYGYGSTSVGAGYELQVIAAVIVGGASFSGGQGSIAGAMAGAMVLYLLGEGLVVYNVKSEYVEIVYGATIILAALLDHFRHGRVLQKLFVGKK